MKEPTPPPRYLSKKTYTPAQAKARKKMQDKKYRDGKSRKTVLF